MRLCRLLCTGKHKDKTLLGHFHYTNGEKTEKKIYFLWNIDIGSAEIPFLIRSEPGGAGEGGGRFHS
jgi:hypothetical protein